MQTKINLYRSGKSMYGGDYWYQKPSCNRFTTQMILDHLKCGVDIDFHQGIEERELLSALSLADMGSRMNARIDKTKTGDTKLLSRILRAGGFCKYLDELEHAAFIVV